MRPAHAGLAVALAVAGLPAGDPVAAAVRMCAPLVTSDIATAPTESAARRQALQSWTSKAKALGEAFAGWRLAHEKALRCTKAAAGNGFTCVAAGKPCSIAQNPAKPPKLPRPKPQGIDV
jgi:hypothetical protein